MMQFNARLNKMIERGWTPKYHGECLDTYNQRSRGGIAPSVLSSVTAQSNTLIVIEYLI